MVDSYTKLLLHCDGADASTTFIDSALGKAVTANGNAQIDTAQSKFGGASGLFDGTGDYLTLADSADWDFSTGAFTIDFWIRFSSIAATQGIINHITNGTNYWAIYWSTSNEITFLKYTDAVETINITKSWTPVINTWYHVALVRNGTNWYFFVDGTQIGTTGSSAYATGNYTGVLRIAQHSNTANHFFGWLDEIRISKGIARWTSNFTPPNRAYNGVGGGFSSGQPWIFMKDMWEKHNKLWKPKGLILPKEGFSY